LDHSVTQSHATPGVRAGVDPALAQIPVIRPGRVERFGGRRGRMVPSSQSDAMREAGCGFHRARHDVSAAVDGGNCGHTRAPSPNAIIPRACHSLRRS